jgi:hypothetical protein
MVDDPSLTSRLFDFGIALGGAWFAVVTGVVLVIEQLLESIAPKIFKSLDRRWPKEQRQTAIRWSIAAAFVYVAFQAYDDVSGRLRANQAELSATRAKLEDSEKRSSRISSSTSRLEITMLNLISQGTRQNAHAVIANQGLIPAQIRSSVFVGKPLDEVSRQPDSDIMHQLEEAVMQSAFEIKEEFELPPARQISPAVFDISKPNTALSVSQEEANEFVSYRINLKIYFAVAYSDEALTSDQVRIKLFCGLFKGPHESLPCPEINRTVTRSRTVSTAK